jgi:hypothetical protein
MHFGTRSLDFFGIHNASSKSENIDSNTWRTVYGDASGNFCGYSVTVKTKDVCRKTTGQVTRPDYYFTTRATSYITDVTTTEHREQELQTKYYDTSGRLRGTSKSIKRDNLDWETTYSSPIPTPEQKRAEQELAEQRRKTQEKEAKNAIEAKKKYERERPVREAKIRQSPADYDVKNYYKSVGGSESKAQHIFDVPYLANRRQISDIKNILKQRADRNPGGASYKTLIYFGWLSLEVKHLRTYYLSQAGFFNANSKIFNKENNTVEEIIAKFKSRAKENPNGASQKTLKQFSIK